jgi:nickel-type superoxide dismutase maturation protease
MFSSLFFKYSPLLLFKIKEHSMEPFLKDNDMVLVFRFLKIKKGDIIVFKKEKKIFIKRVIKIEDNRFIALGDNRKDSYDSRKFGSISKKDIFGRVIMKV